MSNNYNRDYPGGWNGSYQPPGSGGFAAHSGRDFDDFNGQYPSNQSQSGNQRSQVPLYARGSNSYQRGSNSGHNYGSHRGHPQMGSHQQRREHHQYTHDSNGLGNMNAWQSQSSSRGPSSSSQPSRFGGFNPNAPVFTPGAQFVPENDYMMSMQGGNTFRNTPNFAPPSYFPPGAAMQSYCDGLDEETAAYEAMYSNQQEPHQFVPSQELNSLIVNDPHSVRIQEVVVGLEQLISDPDDYDSWSGAIRERLMSVGDEQRSICVRIMIEMLMSCSDASAPMMPHAEPLFARLFELMAKEMPSSVPNAILPNLHRFHSNRALYGIGERAGMLSLMGDIFDRVETSSGTKIEQLGTAIVEHMKEMLKPDCVNESTMKDLIYTAKITGPGLDSLPTTKSANDDLLTLLSAFGKGHPKLSESTKNEIAVLIEQRETGWPSKIHGVSSFGQLSCLSGGAASSSSSSSVPPGSIIGPDGKPLTLSEEERNFLEEQFGDDDGDDMYAEMEKFMREEQEKKQEEQTKKMMDKLKICHDSQQE
ncbi:hypothetical protein PENTCL1PPCAC_6425 [Pristionchus entomophagus]|uniref:Uncharacterized protein n=1 Tax=Pristionchus entomophagus TaxID=358040 RepID=A0AAV5SNV1_9BILA|nr:hypothetical protein PENTCL1PPCAC_6425 [Pristionchus entomophagus]